MSTDMFWRLTNCRIIIIIIIIINVLLLLLLSYTVMPVTVLMAHHRALQCIQSPILISGSQRAQDTSTNRWK